MEGAHSKSSQKVYSYKVNVKLEYHDPPSASYTVLNTIQITLDPQEKGAEVRAISEDGKIFTIFFNRLVISSSIFTYISEPPQEGEGSTATLYPFNLAIYLSSQGKPRYVYFNISSNGRIYGTNLFVDTLEIYDNLSIVRTRIFFKHEDPVRGFRRHEYTVCNTTDFPVKHVYFGLDSYVRGLRIEDEAHEHLILLTNGQLRDLLGEKINEMEFAVVVELNRELKPGECRTISLKSYDEIRRGKKEFEIRIALLDNITEGIVIIPSKGYRVVTSLQRISFSLRDEDDKPTPIVSGNSLKWNRRNQELFPGINLDLFCDPAPENGVVESNTAVDMQFRTTNSQGGRVFVEIAYGLEFQYLKFWRSFLWVMNILLWALFLQETWVHTEGLWKSLNIRLGPPANLEFGIAFLFGAIVGTVSFPFYVESNWRGYMGEIMKSLARRLRKGQPELVSSLIIVILAVVGLTEEFMSLQGNPLSDVSFAYLEIEFAIVVVLELAFVIVERELREEYRNVLLMLVILSMISMLLAVG